MVSHAFVRRVEIPAPPTVVFWDLLDPAHVPEYDSQFRSWVPRDRPPRVGTKVDFVTKVLGLWMKGTSEFVAFDAPHHVELRLLRPRTPLASRLTWHLTPSAAGTTFDYRFEVDAPRGLGWLARLGLRAFTSHLDDRLPALAERYR